MSVLFTVAIIYICYDLTVKTHQRREIKRLNNKVYELEQTLEMALLYGKKTKTKKSEETGKEAGNNGINP